MYVQQIGHLGLWFPGVAYGENGSGTGFLGKVEEAPGTSGPVRQEVMELPLAYWRMIR
jgi:hypothetical protein